MADGNRPGGGEPTEAPTPRKLQDARRRGEVARSAELVSGLVFVAGVGALAALGPWLIVSVADYMRLALSRASAGEMGIYAALSLAAATTARMTVPILLCVMVVALIGAYAHVGSVFTLEPLKPKLDRLNPVQNLKQIFSGKTLFELAKSILKLSGVGFVVGTVLWDFAPRLIGTALRPPEQILVVVGECFVAMAVRVALVATVLAVADLLYQRWSYHKRMRMTKEEVKREQKEGEGDPQHKAERQRLHRELAEQQMFAQAAKADCVVINPTHIAVAIRYEEGRTNAPQVVAHGRGLVAAKIRQIARQNGLPIIRNVPLARALVELELDEEIPGDLYQAVAEVLRFVYRVSQQEKARRGAAGEPELPPSP